MNMPTKQGERERERMTTIFKKEQCELKKPIAIK